MVSSAELEASGLTHAHPGGSELFQPLTFVLTPGEIVGICGPSGSGKSTLLSLLAGWETPRSGRVIRRGIGTVRWVFQNPHGVSRRSALDHVVFPLLAKGARRRDAEEDARRIMEMFALTEVQNREFRALSGGEAQRLMLARAVSTAPDLLLVDEPTAQLDQRTAGTVNATLGNIAASGSIVVIATHDPGTRAACTKVIDLETPRGDS
jgi:lipoprotein-releasing system ATP-binding protein